MLTRSRVRHPPGRSFFGVGLVARSYRGEPVTSTGQTGRALHVARRGHAPVSVLGGRPRASRLPQDGCRVSPPPIRRDAPPRSPTWRLGTHPSSVFSVFLCDEKRNVGFAVWICCRVRRRVDGGVGGVAGAGAGGWIRRWIVGGDIGGRVCGRLAVGLVGCNLRRRFCAWAAGAIVSMLPPPDYTPVLAVSSPAGWPSSNVPIWHGAATSRSRTPMARFGGPYRLTTSSRPKLGSTCHPRPRASRRYARAAAP